MSNDFPYQFQANFKFGPQYKEALVNVPAQSPEELIQKLDWLTENAAKFVAAQAALNGVSEVPALAGNVTKTQVQQDNPPQQGSWAAPQGQQPPSFANPASAAPSCRHGERTYRTGNGKNGKEWKAYFCPSRDRNDQCEAQWVK